MRKLIFRSILLAAAVALLNVTAIFGFQIDTVRGDLFMGSGMEEFRPFDFNDEYYKLNGINPEAIVDRRNGFDGLSVVDYINSKNHRNVRILCMAPVFGFNGEIHYASGYGEVFKKGFTDDWAGREAQELANEFPVYFFPSATMEHKFRQAALIDNHAGYMEKNPIGVGLAVFVEYTNKIKTKKGAIEIELLLKKNGASADGTPTLRTVGEIEDFNRKGLVRLTRRDWLHEQQPAFTLLRKWETVQRGGIAPDSYLVMVYDGKGRMLDNEKIFMDQFECLQKLGNWCW